MIGAGCSHWHGLSGPLETGATRAEDFCIATVFLNGESIAQVHTAEKLEIALEVQAVNANGKARMLVTASTKTSPGKAIIATAIALDDLGPNEFLFFSWSDKDGKYAGENDFFPKPYKAYDVAEPELKANWSGSDNDPVLTLTTDKPALFVTATVDMPGYFSDNALTLLPGRDVKLSFTPRLGRR